MGLGTSGLAVVIGLDAFHSVTVHRYCRSAGAGDVAAVRLRNGGRARREF